MLLLGQRWPTETLPSHPLRPHRRICTPVTAARLAATLRARVSVVPDCGHLSHEEAPGALLALLAPWAAELAGRSEREGSAASAML